ncbi:hypothetical protein U1Q18_025666 [Sarracenia purpurea var. burkii]
MPKDLKQQSIDPSLYRRIIEEALSIHDNLEVFIRDTPMEVKLNELLRSEKKFLEAEVEAYSICPDILLPEKIDAIVARIRKLKSLSPEVGTGIFESPGSESELPVNGFGHEEPDEYRAEVKENKSVEGDGEEDKIGDDEDEEDEGSTSGGEDTVIDETSGFVTLAEMCTEEVEKNKQGLIEEKQRSAQPLPLSWAYNVGSKHSVAHPKPSDTQGDLNTWEKIISSSGTKLNGGIPRLSQRSSPGKIGIF